MRRYNYADKWEKLITPEAVALLISIHEYKGMQNQFIETNTDTPAMLEVEKENDYR